MKLKQYWEARKKALRPAQITVSNIKGFLQSYLRKGRELVGLSLPPHIYEQIVWRRTQVEKESPECLESGFCKVCGCSVIEKTMEDRGCESTSPCYPSMMGEDEWSKYKISQDIKYFL